MRAILIVLMLTVATQAGAECGRLCDSDWWKTANPEDVQAQLDAGANVKASTGEGFTPLHLALFKSASSNVQLMNVEILLAAGADLGARASKSANNWTPLHTAAMFSEVESIKMLLAAGADVSAKDGAGFTALHWAGLTKKIENINALIDAGANINDLKYE